MFIDATYMRMAHGPAGAVGGAKDYSHMASMLYPAHSPKRQSALCVMTQTYLSYLFIYVRPPGPVKLQPAVLWPCHHV